MAQITTTHNNWSAGELSPEMWGRVDSEFYKAGAKSIENFHGTSTGGITRRLGTFTHYSDFTAAVTPIRLIPFKFNQDQSYVIVCLESPNNWYIFDNDGTYLTSIYDSSEWRELGGNLTATHIQEMRYDQAYDTIVLTSRYFHPKRIVRNSHTSWSLTDYPFTVPPTTETTGYPITTADLSLSSEEIGTRTVTDTSGDFLQGDLGRTITLDPDLAPIPRTFTADAGTDIITYSDEAPANYDLMKVQFTTTGTLPAPLQTGVDYWLATTSSTTSEVCATLADAVANTQINITDTGTGVHTMVPVTTGILEITGVSVGGNITGGEVVEEFSTTNLLGGYYKLGGTPAAAIKLTAAVYANNPSPGRNSEGSVTVLSSVLPAFRSVDVGKFIVVATGGVFEILSVLSSMLVTVRILVRQDVGFISLGGEWTLEERIWDRYTDIDTTEQDIYFDSVVLLLDGEGTDGSTTILDTSEYAHTVTAVGNAQIDTSLKKFGEGSILFDGTGDAVTVPASDIFDIASGADFTIEGFYRFASLPSSGNAVSLFFRSKGTIVGTYSPINCFLRNNAGVYEIFCWLSTDGNLTCEMISVNLAGIVGTTAFHHIVINRYNGTLRVYVDGTNRTSSVTGTATTGTYSSDGVFSVSSSATSLNGRVDSFRYTNNLSRYTSGVIVPDRAFPVFTPTNNYPIACCFHDQRLYFASWDDNPQGIVGSKTGNYFSFARGDNDADALSFTITSSQRIKHLVPLNPMIVLTEGTELTVDGGDTTITSTSLQVRPRSYNGCSYITPVIIDTAVCYVSASRKRVFVSRYNADTGSYSTIDLMRTANHITKDAYIIGLTYQPEPYSLITIVLSDGTYATCIFEEEDNVIGWSRHQLANISDDPLVATHGIVYDAMALPNGVDYRLFMIAARCLDATQYDRCLVSADFGGKVGSTANMACYTDFSTEIPLGTYADYAAIQTAINAQAEARLTDDAIIYTRNTFLGQASDTGIYPLTIDHESYIGHPYQSEIEMLVPENNIGIGSSQISHMHSNLVSFRVYDCMDFKMNGDWISRAVTNNPWTYPNEAVTDDLKLPQSQWGDGVYEMVITQDKPVPTSISAMFQRFTINQ